MAVFLKTINYCSPREVPDSYPFNIPALRRSFSLETDKSILVLAGENGVGKSTLLSAVAQQSGFNPSGGNHHHHFGRETFNPLLDAVRLQWIKKVRHGFFLRADRLADLQRYIDKIAVHDPAILQSYGGAPLSHCSHGESMLAFAQYHFRNGIFFLDEPDTALSFKSQLSLVSILKDLVERHKAQFVIATHSPVLMSIPDAQLILMDRSGLTRTTFDATETYKMARVFFDAPERFHQHL